jgi:HTH-type transcriptional regulator / antitoxin MqsA
MKTKQCGSCGGADMQRAVRDVTSSYKGESITVTKVQGWFCADCGEVEFAVAGEGERYSREFDDAVTRIDVAQREYLRATRKRLGLRQAEAAALFGGGVNAFSEYERGVREPSKSTLVLLKLLDRHPELLDEIRAVA